MVCVGWCSLFVVCNVLFVVRWSLCAVCFVFANCCLPCVVCSVLIVGCGSWTVVRCSLFVVACLLCVVC